LLNAVRQDTRIGAAIAVGFALFAGIMVALTMPRSPATQAQALLLMIIGFVVGLVAALAARSRWALPLTLIAYIIAVEVGRLGAAGPTVGAIRLDEPYGIFALVLGRGFFVLVSLLPMMLGASLGKALARRLSGEMNGPKGLLSWAPRVVLVIGVAALFALIAQPASTPPILGADGAPVPGSIASLEMIRLGGQDQWIMIRGHSTDKPVLLYLSGGPGQSDLPYSRIFFAELARDMVIVSWDQRGTGKSYSALDPSGTLTLDQAIADTIELTEYLRTRFDEEKIYLLGESWGSTLGVLAVQRRPDLYHAWIGSGQMVSQRETDRRLYADVLALADRTGNSALAAEMRSYGEPPYADIPYANSYVMGQYEALYKPYTPPQAYIHSGTAANIGFYGILASEYNLVERANVLRGLLDMFTVMYPQLKGIDFRRDVPRLDVPVYILDGEAELTSRRDLMLEWYDQLQAPNKRIFSFADAGHSVVFEAFQEFQRIMVETVLPETYPGR
jgi:pimeloyl-ACP methyl ester carboxylesterase